MWTAKRSGGGGGPPPRYYVSVKILFQFLAIGVPRNGGFVLFFFYQQRLNYLFLKINKNKPFSLK